MRKLLFIAILLLLLFSQGIWLYQFVQKEKALFHSTLETEVQQMLNYEATQHIGGDSKRLRSQYQQFGFQTQRTT